MANRTSKRGYVDLFVMALSAASSLLRTAPVHAQAGNPPEGHHEHERHMGLMTGPLGISRARMGSGTSWLPDSSPMYALMGHAGTWGFMVHGNVFAGYDWVGGRRGGDRFISTNWAMGVAWHELGPGELMFRAMSSVEPLTVGKEGYPLILQSGETVGGKPLHDRQHPHDLFMELAAVYAFPVSDDVAFQFYFALAGEPALGPTAFPHRISSISDPLAPIGHHWQDSTHIAFGVLTAAVFTRTFKLDASWFNGREPDENRWNLDLRVPDSYSCRLTWNPAASWSLQASYGSLRSPEARHPEASVRRVTASTTYNVRQDPEGNFATTFVFGENIPREGPATPAFLFEGAWSLDAHHSVFGRAEYVRKTGDDLALPSRLEGSSFPTGMLSLGYVYSLDPVASLTAGIGLRGSVGFVDSRLESLYGTQLPVGAMLFMQLRPAPMSM